jgi:hypothetical protein
MPIIAPRAEAASRPAAAYQWRGGGRGAGVPVCCGGVLYFPAREGDGSRPFRRRRRSSRRASESPPGRPRWPRRRAVSMARQFSPGASWTAPERAPGQRPVRARCASAQWRICPSVSGGKPAQRPRGRARNCGRVVPPGRPRRPAHSASWTARGGQVAQLPASGSRPGRACTGQGTRTGCLTLQAGMTACGRPEACRWPRWRSCHPLGCLR